MRPAHLLRASATALVAVAILASTASATTLVSDPGAPFTPAQIALMQRWVDVAGGRVRTVPGEVMLSHQHCPGSIEPGCAGDHVIALLTVDRFALMHELGHEDQTFDGPGSPEIAPEDFGYGEGWSSTKVQRLAKLLGLPASPFWGTDDLDIGTNGQTPLGEMSADAYAMCATHPRWTHWWGHWWRHSNPHVYQSTPTPYDFRAGPNRYPEICTALLHLI